MAQSELEKLAESIRAMCRQILRDATRLQERHRRLVQFAAKASQFSSASDDRGLVDVARLTQVAADDLETAITQLVLTAEQGLVYVSRLTARAGNAIGDGSSEVGERSGPPLVANTTGPSAEPGEWRDESGLRLSPDENALVDQHVERTAEVEPWITDRVKRLRDRLPDAVLEGLEHRLKRADSLKRKIATDADSPFGVGVSHELASISDSVRYTLCFPTAAYVVGVRHALDIMPEVGFELIKFKNYWGGSGYQGINSVWWDVAAALTFEVQFHTHESFEAKVTTHHDYEMWRRPDSDDAVKSAAEAHMSYVFRSIPCPQGAVDLHGKDR
ncbi:hypothetical protein CLV30_104265 [Haloactinopolyspora alba]|uniref:Uncharacterized protein n=1 Tax=Haloactinopolyspora alba TaxID=648780 RepID=A0A2P8E7E4_9ACTN|nr:hypothetical protein [Haloactinopolyspora alba]PSL05395.1 hypothetical protein CLV30_104265 [Haloactinopolyspora alba]